MENDEKQEFWRLTFRYNITLLDGLYFVILGFAVSGIADRIDGSMEARKILLYLLVLIVAFGSWIYCIWKSWILTNLIIACEFLLWHTYLARLLCSYLLLRT